MENRKRRSVLKICIFIAIIALPYSCTTKIHAGQVNYDPWYYQDSHDARFWLPDKYQHCAGSYFLTNITGAPISLGAGLLKELYDNKYAGGYSWKDIAANLAGVAAALISTENFRIFPLYNPQKNSILLAFSIRYSRPAKHVPLPTMPSGPQSF